MKLHKLTCPNCDGVLNMEISGNTEKVFCPYCGQQFYVDQEKKEFTFNKNITKNINIKKQSEHTHRNIDDADVIRAKAEAHEKKYGVIIPVALVILMMLICYGVGAGIEFKKKAAEKSGLITVGYSEDYIDEKYEAVVEQFKALGFTNITTIDLDDAGLAFWKAGKVKSISIGGDTSIVSDEYFDKNDPVIITYH